jgi:hypothetical protein
MLLTTLLLYIRLSSLGMSRPSISTSFGSLKYNLNAIFMWFWVRLRTLTGDSLQVRGIDHGENYVLCEQEVEIATHMILSYPYSQVIWRLIVQ